MSAEGPARTGVLDRLRALRDQGRLEDAYDTVAALLARDEVEDDPALLRRIGRMLAGVDRQRVRDRHPDIPVVTIGITGQSTVGPVVDPLTAELARHGLLLEPVLGDHGAYVQDLAGPGGPFGAAELVLCLLDDETVFGRVPAVWRPQDVERAAGEALELLTGLAARHAGEGRGVLVLNTVPLPRERTHQLVDHRSRAELGAVWRDFNSRLLRLGTSGTGLVVLDLDPLIAEGGPVHDVRLARYARSRLGGPLLAAIAREVGHLVRSRHGLTRKCLVLDLDHTLWDGVLAEDGVDGISAAGEGRAEAFGAFQRVIAQIAAQGVLLAVSSKNDRQEVSAALSGLPGAVLRERDFAAIRADWGPKDTQVRDIAERLGIGTGALVFVDDSSAECARVRAAVPEAAVVRLDDEPALHVTRLLRDGWFDTPSLTEDDRDRGRRYRAESQRSAARRLAGTPDGFLRDLETTVDLGPPGPHDWSRAAQLTQRTNRFNLTGLRLTEKEAEAAAAGTGGRVLLVARSCDRFGASGMVGAVLARRTGGVLDIENVWLSCRVLGRGIEQAIVCALLERARTDGCTAVTARYRETRANGRAAGFYPSLGFTERGRDAGGPLFHHDLTDIQAVPEYIELRIISAGKDRSGSGEPRRFPPIAP
ncbi:HAD family hydrolase [Streptomyces sp. A1136]|uniref:HAD-IIIC family phosphatase n=1 Tax=Streptomyces sp. A1136 TaxID=2563102 RepID=UPI0019D11750|nr:HAD-IIIC family phosphatase [Streptomyces sp. A1136]